MKKKEARRRRRDASKRASISNRDNNWSSHGVKSIWDETKSDDQIRYKDLLPPNDT